MRALILQGVHILERAELRGGVRLSQRELDAARRYRRRICLPRPQPYAGQGRRGRDPDTGRPGEPDGGEYLRLLVRLYPARAAHHAKERRRSAVAAEPELCARSEEHTSELQSLMRISYADFCLKKKKLKQYPLSP